MAEDPNVKVVVDTLRAAGDPNVNASAAGANSAGAAGQSTAGGAAGGGSTTEDPNKEHKESGFMDMLTKNMGLGIGGIIGAFLGSFMGPIGILIGALLGAIGGAMFVDKKDGVLGGMFGGGDTNNKTPLQKAASDYEQAAFIDPQTGKSREQDVQKFEGDLAAKVAATAMTPDKQKELADSLEQYTASIKNDNAKIQLDNEAIKKANQAQKETFKADILAKSSDIQELKGKVDGMIHVAADSVGVLSSPAGAPAATQPSARASK